MNTTIWAIILIHCKNTFARPIGYSVQAQSSGVEEVFSTDCDSCFHNENILIRTEEEYKKCKLIQSVEKSRRCMQCKPKKAETEWHRVLLIALWQVLQKVHCDENPQKRKRKRKHGEECNKKATKLQNN